LAKSNSHLQRQAGWWAASQVAEEFVEVIGSFEVGFEVTRIETLAEVFQAAR
jgi:hypothetical protein